MLRICTKQEYKKYADFAYELALDQSRSGYPAYSDGIKTKAMFLDRSEKAFSRDTEEILLFEYNIYELRQYRTIIVSTQAILTH